MNSQTTPLVLETSFSLWSALHRFFPPRSKRTIRHFDSVPLSRLISTGERVLLATEKFSRSASLHYPSEWCELSSLCVYIKALLRTRLFRMEQNRGSLSFVSVTSHFAQQTWIKIGLRWKLLYGDASVCRERKAKYHERPRPPFCTILTLSLHPSQLPTLMTSPSISIQFAVKCDLSVIRVSERVELSSLSLVRAFSPLVETKYWHKILRPFGETRRRRRISSAREIFEKLLYFL